jgi:hypothetical protein
MEAAMVLRRVARAVGLDRNPLRRTVDRLDTWVTLGLTAIVLLVGPLIAWTVGTTVYHSRLHAVRVAQAQRFQVPAVLEEGAVTYAAASEYATVPRQTHVRARWFGPDGRVHRGDIDVETDAAGPPGTVVTTWTDAVGNPVAAPPAAGDAATDGVAGGVLVLMVLCGLAISVRVWTRHALDRRRLASWDLQWRSVEPRWSGRR